MVPPQGDKKEGTKWAQGPGGGRGRGGGGERESVAAAAHTIQHRGVFLWANIKKAALISCGGIDRVQGFGRRLRERGRRGVRDSRAPGAAVKKTTRLDLASVNDTSEGVRLRKI